MRNKPGRKHELESAILDGDGNGFVTAELAQELFQVKGGEVAETTNLVRELRRSVKELQSGDNSSLVSQLNSQLSLLNILFTRTAKMATAQQNPERMLALLDMALKVQNHCRRASSTIHELTRPAAPVSYIKANNANVATNQQINYSENELGDRYGMDTRSTSASGRADQGVEALVEVDGS